MPVKAVVTYDGLPVSSGGGHTLRSRRPRDTFDQITHFLGSCTAPLQPVRFTIELVTGNGIPEHFSAPLLSDLIKLYGSTNSRSLGGNTGHIWAIQEKDVESTLALIDGIRPLPVHPYRLQPISLNVLSFFRLINPVNNSPYPYQDPESCLHFQPGFGQQLGVSQAYARISERSTLSLFLNFPALDEDSELVQAVRAVQEHLPFQLSKSHWKRWSLTRRGDSYMGRKISAPCNPPIIRSRRMATPLLKSAVKIMDSDPLTEQIKEVYANFGLAIYQAQCLEHGLVNALVFLDLIPNQRKLARSVSEWGELVDSFMDSKFEFTLGKMVRALKEVTHVDPLLQEQLAGALAKRNWLAHSYFRERAEAFLTQSGRDLMRSELEAIQATFSQADSALDAAIKPAREKVGLTDEVLAAAYAKLRIEVGE